MAMATETSKAERGGRRATVARPSLLAWITVPLRRVLGHYVFSSLTRRILVLNLAAIGVLVAGILYLNQFREGLIDARVESLMTQGEIIAGAVAASATVETDSISIDPEKLLELQAGERHRQARQPGFPDQSGTRRAGPQATDLAHAYPRPHLRPRRQPAA
jgi:two-component system, OmpR family, sensor histidine kinase ChvG